MKELLKQKAALQKQMDDIIRTTDHKSEEERLKMTKLMRPILSQVDQTEKTLDQQRARLGVLLHKVLQEVRSLAEAGSKRQIVDLLQAAGDLPHQMFDDQGFAWDALRREFQDYQERYSATYDYVALLDEIRSCG